MTGRQIIKKLEEAGFVMSNVVEVSRDYLEVFNGNGCDRDGNEALKEEAARVTGLRYSCNIAYGGFMLSASEFSIDAGNRQ